MRKQYPEIVKIFDELFEVYLVTNAFQCCYWAGFFSATIGPGKGKGDGSLYSLPNLPNRGSVRMIICMISLLPLHMLNISIGQLKFLLRKSKEGSTPLKIEGLILGRSLDPVRCSHSWRLQSVDKMHVIAQSEKTSL